MRSRGPLITLLAGLVLAGVLLTLSMNATRSSELAAGAANEPAAPDNGAAAPAEISPEEPAPESPAPEKSEGAGKDGEDSGQQPGGTPAANLNVTWAGRVTGGRATIAITAKGEQAIAYLCDGSKIEAWLQGTAKNGKLDLATRGNSAVEAKLTGTFGNGRAKGKVTAAGSEFAFDVGTAKKPSGLYRVSADVRGARLVGGWIVLADGTQVGLATFAGSTVSVPRLDVASGSVTMYGERLAVPQAVPGGMS